MLMFKYLKNLFQRPYAPQRLTVDTVFSARVGDRSKMTPLEEVLATKIARAETIKAERAAMYYQKLTTLGVPSEEACITILDTLF